MLLARRQRQNKTAPPSLSTVSPTRRPGMLRTNFFWQAKNPKAGPPRFIGTPKLCPSPTAISTPNSPGGLSSPNDNGSRGYGNQLRAGLRRRRLGSARDLRSCQKNWDNRPQRTSTRSSRNCCQDWLHVRGPWHQKELLPERHRREIFEVRAHHGAVLRMKRPATSAPGAARRLNPARHQHGLGRGRRAVIDRGVGNLHAGELADQRLIFEQRLQGALAYLGLVRRIRGREFRARNNRVDCARNEMMVDTSAKKQTPAPESAFCAARAASRLRRASSLSPAVNRSLPDRAAFLAHDGKDHRSTPNRSLEACAPDRLGCGECSA